jgi:hypothetical protein
MERGVYFDAWFPRQHNYHPSMPPRRLRMVEHLEELHATMLCWSALGGGVISLPYLEEEAFASVPPRYRVYGFLNDAEFIEECGKRGIDVFGIVFEHAWEYAVELNEDESEVLSWNELRGAGHHKDWLGMREFWQNRYPKLWKSLEHYFPDGVRNADGEIVEDILEECAQRDIHGEPCRALWVECPDREHYNYMMDRNNPVWREYLKAIVRIQIDAGVQGVQFDETEVPITSLQYGGCFCRTCMRGFTEYLRGLDRRPSDLDGTDLDGFDYGSWLLERGYDFKSGREDTPLFWDYLSFQRGNIVRYFAELADYTREYARSKGRDVLVSGNFFNLFDHYYAMEPWVDVIVTEMRNTTYRQPAWYRYAAGFGGDKPVVVVENPYGGVVPDLVEMLGRGRGYDLFRMSLYEAAAMGVNMTVPYGAWMGSVIEDAFYPPYDLAREIQDFLAENERLFSTRTWSEVAVVFSVESNFRRIARRELMQDNRENVTGEEVVPFWRTCEALSAATQPYDVVFFPEGDLRADTLEVEDLAGYARVVLPDCIFLTEAQARVLRGYLDGGGRLVVLGELGMNLSEARRHEILEHPGTSRRDELGTENGQVSVEGAGDIAVNIHRAGDGAALHFIRYDYDEATDRVPRLDEATIEVRLPTAFAQATAFSPCGELKAELAVDGMRHRLTLRNVPPYGIVLLEP